MNYRVEEHDDDADLQENIMGLLMANRDDLVDMLLILANVAEARVLLNSYNPSARDWYTSYAKHVRKALDDLTTEQPKTLPDAAYENPILYYDVPSTQTH